MMDKELLLTLGKAQITALFNRQEEGPAIDDSEFLPLLQAVLTAFETVGVEQEVVGELWDYAFQVYDLACKEAEPESTTKDNRRLMHSYLLRPRRRKR